MSPTIYGSISYRDKSYPFFLEGHSANIVGTAWEYYEDFRDADEEESIFGVTADNREILFLRCRFDRSSSRQKVRFSFAGYILSSRKSDDPYDFTFGKISFYSEALNAFYPPQQAMKTHVNPQDWNGRMTIEFNSFEENTISFVYKECRCQLSISRYVIDQDGKSDIGNINSVFSFEFNTTQPYSALPQYYLALFDFLSFVNYGTNIKFDRIELSKKCENGSVVHCANAYLFSDRGEYLPKPFLKTITAKDIPRESLGAVFSKIADLRGKDWRLEYYFPENYREESWIDANRWLVKAMTFEGLFKQCNPDFKQNKKKQFRSAKTAALAALQAVDQSEMSKRECEYFKKCQEQIERYEGLLEEMLNSSVKEYKDALGDLLRFNRQEYNINLNAYGAIYSRYRNKIAHGDIEPVGKQEIAVYRVLQATIYFMLLKDTGLGSDTFRVIAKKLFL